jgi:predicted alpha/beta-fold hydrolase
MLYILFLVIAICVIYLIIKIANKKLLFHPQQYSKKELKKVISTNKNHIKRFNVKALDNNAFIECVLINSRKPPSIDDNILLYSYGNAGSIRDTLLYSNMLTTLLKYFTVCVYDYRGYGASTGDVSEEGLYTDGYSVFNYLLQNGANSQNITIMGHSLGSSISSNIALRLIEEDVFPKALILQAGFCDIREIANDLHGFLSYFVLSNFNNATNVSKIDNRIPVYVLHSRTDELISYRHAKKISSSGKCELITIGGDHNEVLYNDAVFKLFDFLTK